MLIILLGAVLVNWGAWIILRRLVKSARPWGLLHLVLGLGLIFTGAGLLLCQHFL